MYIVINLYFLSEINFTPDYDKVILMLFNRKEELTYFQIEAKFVENTGKKISIKKLKERFGN